MPNRFVHTVWCDDIRQEVGNKPSLMGVYTGNIVLPQLPFTLPRLALFNWISSPIDQPFDSDIHLTIRRDDGFVFLQLKIEKPQEVEPAEEASRYQLGMAFGIGPVEFPPEAKFLVVEARIGDEVITGPKLRVTVDKAFIDQMMPAALQSVVDRVERMDPGQKADS